MFMSIISNSLINVLLLFLRLSLKEKLLVEKAAILTFSKILVNSQKKIDAGVVI